jgi:N-acetylglucosamine kinase-like BadF-type ATPase
VSGGALNAPVAAFLGVDGGGTKTALAVVSADGRVLAQRVAPSAYYLGAGAGGGLDLVRRVLGEAVPSVCADAGVMPEQLRGAFFGLPAYGEASADTPTLDAIPAEVLGHTRYRCDNDMVCGWAGSLGLAAGINVISGTGSMTYGERAGRHVRVGGWGELVGDEGSAYWLGVRGLQAWTRMTDGRAPVGPLHALLAARLDLADPLDLVSLVHETWGGDRSTIAALAPLVVEAADAGDPVAAHVVDEGIDELVRLVTTTAERLGFGGEVVATSCSGGVFRAARVLRRFEERLAAAGAYELRTARFTPVVGAALYAAREVGEPLDAAALARLERGHPADR